MKDFRNEIAPEYQDLFNFMEQEHDLILTVEQMDEIVLEARKFEDSYNDKMGQEIAEMSDKEFDSNCKKLKDALKKQNKLNMEHENLNTEETANSDSGAVSGSANHVSNLDQAIMYLEADQSVDEEIDIKQDKLLEAKKIIASVFEHYR